ncbi:hypothetical protein SADUNF_Sadunf06G0154000 [Salix dunnii]|uniref:Uncharacterized protein n=1 Tax=Salix dunnii TaxID=1413687 RepID=A0A835MXC5_9ROSI|nr:hypothetical protein SADUNF_Sadunf06G0154000 [Salix dunnii]
MSLSLLLHFWVSVKNKIKLKKGQSRSVSAAALLIARQKEDPEYLRYPWLFLSKAADEALPLAPDLFPTLHTAH